MIIDCVFELTDSTEGRGRRERSALARARGKRARVAAVEIRMHSRASHAKKRRYFYSDVSASSHLHRDGEETINYNLNYVSCDVCSRTGGTLFRVPSAGAPATAADSRLLRSYRAAYQVLIDTPVPIVAVLF